jgi:hypothetical protein
MSSDSPTPSSEDDPAIPPSAAEEDLPEALPAYGPAERARTAARRRVGLVSAALIGVGALNLTLAFPLLIGGVWSMSWAEDESKHAVTVWSTFQASVLRFFPGFLLPPPSPPDEMKTMTAFRALSWGWLDLASSVLTLVAGIRMRVLRNLRLVVSGALVTALPFLSCSACCGVGEIVGGWALLVLLDPEIRRAFR